MQTKPEVYVNRAGVWFFRNNPIENESILNYFKRNLKRDAEGLYYIENKFGERQEEGYIQGVEGFPLVVRTLGFEAGAKASLECEIEYTLDPDFIGAAASTEPTLLFYEGEDIIWTIIQPEGSSRGVPVRLSGPCMASLYENMEESASGFTLKTPSQDYPILERSPRDFFQKIDFTPPAEDDNPIE